MLGRLLGRQHLASERATRPEILDGGELLKEVCHGIAEFRLESTCPVGEVASLMARHVVHRPHHPEPLQQRAPSLPR